MITRAYFVAYIKDNQNGSQTIGAFIIKNKSWLPRHFETFIEACEHAKKEHDASITDFRKI